MESFRDGNAFTRDPAFAGALDRLAPDLLARHGAQLADFGAWVAGPLDRQAEQTDRFARPRLIDWDREGRRIGRVAVDPAYAACHAEAYRRGAVGAAFGADGARAPHLLSFAMGYLLSQADIAIHCPVTMTGAVAHVLDRVAPAALRDRVLPDLIRLDGRAASAGTWVTELHGGSDVGATTTRAVADGEAWRLSGLKWFASNAGSDWALATARPEGADPGSRGLGCYLVPERASDGTPNRYAVRRLKDKLGTRALPTGEIDLDGAEAFLVAPPPLGLAAMMAALGYSRIHNAFAAVAVQRRALVEAASWALLRRAFGRPIIDYPMVRALLVDLAAALEADRLLALEAGLAFDAADRPLAPGGGAPDDDWLRVATALAKYRTAENAVAAASRAVELVGGNGYTEEYATARLYRDALVTVVWEGPGNIQALELLRLVSGRRDGDRRFLARVDAILGALPAAPDLAVVTGRLAMARAASATALADLRARPESGPEVARLLLALLADTLALALLAEAAAAGLAAGDRRCLLLAGRLARQLGGRLAPLSLDPDPAEAAAEALVAGLPVA